jgi:hypothetical protein
VSTTWALPAVAVRPVGASGTVGGGATGVAVAGAEAGPGPTALVAITVNE